MNTLSEDEICQVSGGNAIALGIGGAIAVALIKDEDLRASVSEAVGGFFSGLEEAAARHL